MSYRYIHSASKFTQKQKDFYEENGYILIKNSVSYELIDKLHDRFIDIAEGKQIKLDYDLDIVRDPDLRKKGVPGQYQINKIQHIVFDEVFGEYFTCDNILDVVENIIGPNFTAIHSMLINKPPNTDSVISKHPAHQDLHYFPFRPAEKIVAAWTAMENVNVDNGCVFVYPGTHCSPLYAHSYPQNTTEKKGFFHGVQGVDDLPKVDLIMEKGDTVFFHPLLLHGSYPNRTTHFRKSISCHYADSNCRVVDTRNSLQKNVAKEVEAYAVKVFNTKTSFEDFWKLKSRLVRGLPGELQKKNSHL